MDGGNQTSHGVVAVGDSWMTGYGLPLGGLSCLSWAGWLAWARAACLTQHAVNGATAEQVVRDQLPLLGPRGFHLGVVWVGANDLSRLEVDSFTGAMTEMCLALGAACEVVAVATLPDSVRTPDLSWRASAAAVTRANECIRLVSHATGAVLVELEDALRGPWAMAPDRQHPTSLGQLEAAHVAAGSLTSLLLLRELPSLDAVSVPNEQRQLYDVTARDRVRAALTALRQRREERRAAGGRQ